MTEVKKSKSRKILKRLFLAVLAGLLLGILLLCSIIVPDQFRSVSTPPENVWLYVEAGSAKSDGFEESLSAVKQDVREKAEGNTGKVERTPASSDVWLQKGGRFLTPAELAEMYRPFPDPSKLPEEFRETAERMNECVDKLLDIPSKWDGKSPKESSAMVGENRETFSKYAEEFADKRRSYMKSHSSDIMTDSAILSYRDRYTQARNRVCLAFCAEFEEWFYAGIYCTMLETGEAFGPPRYDSYWWPCTVYYWRKAGDFNSRLHLAYRSSYRIMEPAGRYLLDAKHRLDSASERLAETLPW